jgi:hypothetical protein
MVNFGWPIDEPLMVDENHVGKREEICSEPDNCYLEYIAPSWMGYQFAIQAVWRDLTSSRLSHFGQAHIGGI